MTDGNPTWQLDPDSPFYDEFSEIEPGQWWILTPNGLIGCSDEEDAKEILRARVRVEELERKLTAAGVVDLMRRAEDAERERDELIAKNDALLTRAFAAEAALRKIGVEPTPDQMTCRKIARAALDGTEQRLRGWLA